MIVEKSDPVKTAKTMEHLYAYPLLHSPDLAFIRLGGPGLGNHLFTWARCVVACEIYGLRLIAPTWPQIKIGPLLRGEPDKRFYFGLFKAGPGQVGGLRKSLLLLGLPKLRESVLFQDTQLDSTTIKRGIVLFRGMDGMFKPILAHNELIKKKLLEITDSRHKVGLAMDFSDSISVHVRLTDFVKPTSIAAEQSGGHNQRTSISWFVEMVKQIRNATKRPMPVHIFSDGSDDELAELLTEPGTARLTTGSSIGDILALSQANILIASGSTFSMWASYLGRMPVIWPVGQLRHLLYRQGEAMEIEGVPGSPLPEQFISTII